MGKNVGVDTVTENTWERPESIKGLWGLSRTAMGLFPQQQFLHVIINNISNDCIIKVFQGPGMVHVPLTATLTVVIAILIPVLLPH